MLTDSKQPNMKLRLFILTSLLLFLLVNVTTAQKQYSLEALEDHPDFDVSVEAKGGYGDQSIVLRITSSHRKDVELLTPAGTVFFTKDEDHQILITVEEELIAIGKEQQRKKILDGYCTEASDGVPGAEMAMNYQPTQREKLQHLANFLNRHRGIDPHAIQEAVWCVSDGNPLSYIHGEDAKKTKLLTQFVATLTDQDLPWNTVQRRHRISDGRIESQAVLVTGQITFSTAKETTIKGKILNAEGQVINDDLDTMTLPKTTSARLNFSLSVSGWDPGTYKVIYYDQDGQVLLQKAFEI